MEYVKKTWQLLDNYVIARWQKRPSTALFWYLPEPPTIRTHEDLIQYQQGDHVPPFLIDYRKKLQYSLTNEAGIIVLPYDAPIGNQVNPEAAFQYALGLHHEYVVSHDVTYLTKFWQYVDYFVTTQTKEGLWEYHFDWFASKAPWSSALAQSRGAAVMLRAWLYSNDSTYLTAAKNALGKFLEPTTKGGFLHRFPFTECDYFEEYPQTPTAVMNGFMSALICIWEMKYWVKEKWIEELWELGIQSLEKMLPYYSIGWWVLYDLDQKTPIVNVNSPRYHLLEMHYLQILSLLTGSSKLHNELHLRREQYKKHYYRYKALVYKLIRKVVYR